MSIASARDEIRRRRKLVPVGADPLVGPWRILSTSGDYSHELRLDNAGVVTSSQPPRGGLKSLARFTTSEPCRSAQKTN
jgi:hypothetical protein